MINIVPKPYYIMEKSGVKVLDKNSAVSADERLKDCICAFSDTFDFIGEKNYSFDGKNIDKSDVKILYAIISNVPRIALKYPYRDLPDFFMPQ